MSSTNTSVTNIAPAQVPRPSAPSQMQNNLYQDVSFYKAMRSMRSMGSVTGTASDGTPATFNSGSLDSVILRVYGAGSLIAPAGAPMWIAGGGETQIAHGLNRVPIGYIPIRKHMEGVDIYDGDSAWDTTYIYFHTTHSDSDVILMIF